MLYQPNEEPKVLCAPELPKGFFFRVWKRDPDDLDRTFMMVEVRQRITRPWWTRWMWTGINKYSIPFKPDGIGPQRVARIDLNTDRVRMQYELHRTMEWLVEQVTKNLKVETDVSSLLGEYPPKERIE